MVSIRVALRILQVQLLRQSLVRVGLDGERSADGEHFEEEDHVERRFLRIFKASDVGLSKEFLRIYLEQLVQTAVTPIVSLKEVFVVDDIFGLIGYFEVGSTVRMVAHPQFGPSLIFFKFIILGR